ncbi:hypothetical protein [Rubrimonas cliftonensis]|uniref:Uncharacterized protein n=1 Tax=Rubrimonas cliftonensis TaxID=89524 RepID=A0A1H4EKR9_9RHOB|nr:hypothetical protein [Rubrimonas cliftonensis]SEA85653.1 hypothetical protein SAMN05444370_11482 [Rubrimonas cliftonensis]
MRFLDDAVIVMANRLVTAIEAAGQTETRSAGEWILVRRRPQTGRLWVSDSESFDLADPPSVPPSGLRPRNTIVAALLRGDAAREEYGVLLTPDDGDAAAPGTFFPTLGVLTLTAGPDGVRLNGAGIVGRRSEALWIFDALSVATADGRNREARGA